MPRPGFKYPTRKPVQPSGQTEAFTEDGCSIDGMQFFCLKCPFPKCRAEVSYPTFRKWLKELKKGGRPVHQAPPDS